MEFLKIVGTLLVPMFVFGFSLTYGAQDDDEDDSVNILFIYEGKKPKDLFEAALEFIRSKTKIKVGEVHHFDATGYEDSVKITSKFCKTYNETIKSDHPPDIAIDFTRISVPSEGVKVVLAAVNMPTIAATFGQEHDVREWRNLNKTHEKYLIQISPPADVMIQIVRSMSDKQDMTSAVVLFDEEEYEMYHKYKSLLQNLPVRHLLTKPENAENGSLSAQISRLVHQDIVNFYIAGTNDRISEVLQKASDPKAKSGPYFSDEFAWYSMTLETGQTKYPTCTKCDMDVTLVHLIPEAIPDSNNRKKFLKEIIKTKEVTLTQMFYFDVAIDAVQAVSNMKKAGTYNVKTKGKSCDFDADKYEVKKKDMLFIDLLAEFNKTSKDNGIPFHLGGKTGLNYPQFNVDIKHLSYNATKPEPKVVHIGKWKAGFKEKELVTFDAGKDLEKHKALTVFRIVTHVQPPFVMKIANCSNKNKTEKYNNCFKGYCIELLKYIVNDLKFNYTIREVEDGYGYMNLTYPHNWTGLVRELVNKEADIALGAMSVMAERESAIDFTVPYYDLVGISILMKKPKVPTSLFKFLTVLENDVWMCILGSYFLTSILLWFFDRWSPYSYQNNREKYEDDEEKREFTLKECLWFCMTSLTPQGGGEAPKNLSGRLVAATWWLFGFIIIASYTANLAAFLTVSRLDAPIESLEDLAKQYKVQYAPMVGSSAWIYFDRMSKIERRFYEIWKDMSLNDSMTEYEKAQLAVWDYPVSDKYTKMYEAMKMNNPPTNFTEAVERVRAVKADDIAKEEDGFAFLDEATNVKWQTTISCDFDQKGEEFSRKPYAIAVQKGSPLKESISHVILKLLNQRSLEKLKEDFWNDDSVKVTCEKDDNQSDGISIHNIGGVFIVIFVGIVMACFTLIFEYWWYRKRDVAEELAEMELPSPKEYEETSSKAEDSAIEKTNFDTQYDKPRIRTNLPSIENSW